MRQLIPILFLLIAVCGQPSSSVAAQGDVVPTLDLVFALDVSGSMDVDTNSNTYRSVDVGWNLLSRALGSGNLPATDPQGTRFMITEGVMEWLAQYALAQDNALRINASVVAFSDSPTVLQEWTPLRRDSGADRLLSPLDQSARRTIEEVGAQNANFIALYEQIATLTQSQPSEGARRVVIVITDSAPCYPSGIRPPVYWDSVCGELLGMDTHVGALPSVNAASEYVLFASSATTQQRWANYRDANYDVRQAWEQRLQGRGAIIDLDTIDDLTTTLMDVVLREVALTRGLATADELPVGQPLTQAAYAGLKIAYSPSGTFTVGPYQSSVTIMTALPNRETILTFSSPDDSAESGETLFDSEESALRLARLSQPPNGEWSLRANNSAAALPTWALYRSAEAQLRLLPQNPTQYQPQQWVYELLDETGQPFAVSAELAPQFTISVVPRGGEAPMNLGDTMRVAQEGGLAGNAFMSAPFLPVQAGEYTLTVNVTEGASSAWAQNADNSFLQPANANRNFQVDSVSFVPDYTIVQPEGYPSVGRVSNIAVQMPRSLSLNVRVEMTSSSGSPLSIAEGLSAQLVYTSPANETSACPDWTPLLLPSSRQEGDNDTSFNTQIRFELAGACQIEVALALNSSLQPLSGGSLSIAAPDLGRLITVTPTERLSVRLVGNDGQPLDPTALLDDTPEYVMDDREPTPLRWADNTLILRLEVRDEEGDLVSPEFLPEASAPDRSYCRQSDSITPLPTGEAETSTETPALVDESVIVPFVLSITNSAETDVADERGICLYATDSPGVYLASITGLSPDRYEIYVRGNRTVPPLNFERMEYAPGLFETDVDNDFEVAAGLQINANPLIALQIGGSATAAVLITSLIAIVIIRWHRATVAPLNVALALYAIAKTQPEPMREAPDTAVRVEALWQAVARGKNAVSYRDTAFLGEPKLLLLNIEQVDATTRREREVSRSGAAYIHMKVNGSMVLDGEKLDRGTARLILEKGNMGYYLTNGINNPTRHMLLSAGRGEPLQTTEQDAV